MPSTVTSSFLRTRSLPEKTPSTSCFAPATSPLNRNPEFLYSLFVPARAHLAFPCFDQPDLKARYTLELAVPAGWAAVANGAELSRDTSGDRTRIRYGETQPIPTYLFAFAAGQFQIETAERDGRTYPDVPSRDRRDRRSARNRETRCSTCTRPRSTGSNSTPGSRIRSASSISSSMPSLSVRRHGASGRDLLQRRLGCCSTNRRPRTRCSAARASIAHETSHMWFGDLVTMRWFNDVWMKEVFASFMAAKIVNPSLPDDQPRAALPAWRTIPPPTSVDRTAGTHPIRQELDNLNEAGSLYGAIIYQKAPIVMRQLEQVLGAGQLQEGLRVYLKQFAFGNASWLDLVRVLDERSDRDLAAWSRVWVEEAGRPSIRTELDIDENDVVRRAGVHPE